MPNIQIPYSTKKQYIKQLHTIINLNINEQESNNISSSYNSVLALELDLTNTIINTEQTDNINSATNYSDYHPPSMGTDNLNFIQCNLQNSRAAIESLMGYANKNKIEVLLLQDFYHPNNQVHAVPSSRWLVFTSDNMTAAVVISKEIIQAVKAYSDNNSVFVNITTTTGKLTVGSIYAKPKGNLLGDMAWLDYFDPLQKIIAGGDLNVHLSLLGYKKDDERGNILTYLLLSKKLILLNDTEAPSTFIGEVNRPCS